MSYPIRGIVEGFYGRPWSHADRLEIFAFMQQHGLNGYIYAPKDDELHRDNWRAPYPGPALDRFRTLATAARSAGIRFTFAMSPGLSLRYSDPAEVETLAAKVAPLLDVGVPSLGIFFDDVPVDLRHPEDRARFDGLGDAQAAFLTAVQARLPGIHLVTVPTYYCGEPDIPYLHALGAMPAEIDIMWTGPAICSQTLTQEHLADVAAVLRRPALIWDNYPVNDAGMIAELHIGPYRGRAADLPVRGIYANPMSMAAASSLPLATFAAYCAAPVGYDPDAAWQVAAVSQLGPELAAALAVFADAVTISPLTPEPPAAMLALFAPFAVNRLPFTPNPAPEHLRLGTARMRAAYDTLQAAAAEERPLLAEIAPWLAEYGRWIALLEAASRMIDARLSHREPDAEEAALHRDRATIRQGLKDAVDFRTAVCGDVVRNFLQELLRRTGEPVG